MYSSAGQTGLVVGSWRAVFGRFTPAVSASTTHATRTEELGSFELMTQLRQTQIFAQGEWIANQRITLRTGGELEWLRSAFGGSVPSRSADIAPGSRIRVVGSNDRGLRSAVLSEGDLCVGDHTRIVLGLRSDSSSLTHEHTLDPRISTAVKTGRGVTLTAAWGVYHEIPDPLLFNPTLGDTTLGSMRAVHSIVGAQVGESSTMARIELYDKRYSDLAQQTRDYSTSADGHDYARGADVFLKWLSPLGTSARLTYSHVLSRRTDPNTGTVANAPFDIPNSLTLIVERKLGDGWQIGSAYRYATRRPITPVLGATRDTAEYRWAPIYGAPTSERLPHFARLDVSVSQLRQLCANWHAVLYASVNSVLARSNVFDYTYSADFTERKAVSNLFNRSLYFGATLIH